MAYNAVMHLEFTPQGQSVQSYLNMRPRCLDRVVSADGRVRGLQWVDFLFGDSAVFSCELGASPQDRSLTSLQRLGTFRQAELGREGSPLEMTAKARRIQVEVRDSFMQRLGGGQYLATSDGVTLTPAQEEQIWDASRAAIGMPAIAVGLPVEVDALSATKLASLVARNLVLPAAEVRRAVVVAQLLEACRADTSPASVAQGEATDLFLATLLSHVALTMEDDLGALVGVLPSPKGRRHLLEVLMRPFFKDLLGRWTEAAVTQATVLWQYGTPLRYTMAAFQASLIAPRLDALGNWLETDAGVEASQEYLLAIREAGLH